MLAGGGLAKQLGEEAIKRAMGDYENVPKTISEEEAVPEPSAQPEPDIFERPEGVPEEWEASPSDKGDGIRYRDPDNIHNEVRIQRGRPEVSNRSQQQDYVRWKKDGQWLDQNGNPSTDYKETHIPIGDFKFDPEIFQ